MAVPRLISPEPVLAKILSSRKPVLIGEEGYWWLVQQIATIGTILRSQENILSLAVWLIDSALLNAAFSLVSAARKKFGIGGAVLRGLLATG